MLIATLGHGLNQAGNEQYEAHKAGDCCYTFQDFKDFSIAISLKYRHQSYRSDTP